MVYGSEALPPAEVGMISYRIMFYDPEVNAEVRRAELHLVDEAI